MAENPLGSNGYAPKAARMLKMVYDCTVEQTALNHAKQCQFKHSKSSGNGENLWMISPAKNNLTAMATLATQSWFNELKKAGVPPDNRLTVELWNRPNKVVGHYTQMVWETSYKLGCGIALCQRMTLVVCQYAPRQVLAFQYLSSCT
uniref:SCP domain-containing protein n=1 Tax=Angiostrongylus cantonensis TaxID=6313 RepID=A0A0K0DGU2_ANGCA